MKGYYKVSRERTLFWAGFLLLLVSFCINIFGLGPNQEWFTYFQQKDSAAIIRKTVECKNQTAYDGPLVWETYDEYQRFTETPTCEEAVVRPYESQYGLQARVSTLLAPSASINYYRLAELALAAFFAAVLMAFIYKVRAMFNMRVALVVFLLILLSPWIAAYARNMYWVVYLMFLPFVFSFVTYDWFKKSKRLHYFFIALFVLFYLKLLNGYEHVSTLMVSALVPIVFYELLDRRLRIGQLLKPAVFVFVAGVFALGLAILTNISSLAGYYGSWGKATDLVLSRAEDRASQIKTMQPYVIGGFEVTLPDMYHYIDVQYDLDRYKDGKAHPIKYAVISILNYSLLPAVSLPIVLKEPLHTFAESILCIGVLSYLAILSVTKKGAYRRFARSLKYSYWLSLLGALSWLVLMPAHAYPHAHLNAIIFYAPFLLVCYLAVGLWVSGLGVWRGYGKD